MQKCKLYCTITQFVITMWLPAETLVICVVFNVVMCLKCKGIHSVSWANLWKYYQILYLSILFWEVIDNTSGAFFRCSYKIQQSFKKGSYQTLRTLNFVPFQTKCDLSFKWMTQFRLSNVPLFLLPHCVLFYQYIGKTQYNHYIPPTWLVSKVEFGISKTRKEHNISVTWGWIHRP